MCRRTGVHPGRAVPDPGAPPRARRALRRGQRRPGGCRAAGPGAGLPAAAADVRRADRARRRRHPVAAPGRRDLPAAAVLPRLWPHPEVRPVPAGLALSAGGGAGKRPTSWTALLDVVRLGPAEDATAVTADQLRAVIGRLRAAGHWSPGDPPMLVVLDAGYDVCRLAFLLADLPIQLIGRIRADRVMLTAVAPPPAHRRRPTGRPRRHGAAMTLADLASWPEPSTRTTSETARYGCAQALSWDRMHPRLTHRGAWAAHPGRLPIVEGTLIRLAVEHLPGARAAKPVWLWTSALGADAAAVTRCW